VDSWPLRNGQLKTGGAGPVGRSWCSSADVDGLKQINDKFWPRGRGSGPSSRPHRFLEKTFSGFGCDCAVSAVTNFAVLALEVLRSQRGNHPRSPRTELEGTQCETLALHVIDELGSGALRPCRAHAGPESIETIDDPGRRGDVRRKNGIGQSPSSLQRWIKELGGISHRWQHARREEAQFNRLHRPVRCHQFELALEAMPHMPRAVRTT